MASVIIPMIVEHEEVFTGRSGDGFPSLLRGFSVKMDVIFIRSEKSFRFDELQIGKWEPKL